LLLEKFLMTLLNSEHVKRNKNKMIEIVSETKFRSKPTVNMTDDMVRVVLDMPFMDWVVIKKSLIETEEWFDKCEEKREKKKEKEKDIEYYMKLPYKIIIEPIPKNEGGGYSASIPQLGEYAFTGDGKTIQEALDHLEIVKRDLFFNYLRKRSNNTRTIIIRTKQDE